jgi:uncharacterized membrane-anchored protein
MTRRILFGVLALVLVIVNVQIARKEILIRDGRTVLLPLAPVDPRSLMQGDYMILNYQVTNDLFRAHSHEDGHVVLRLDEQGVGAFVRLHDGRPLAKGEQLLRYRIRGYRARLGAEAFFFQEGHGKHYERAAFGELRVTPAGDSVLVGLRDREKVRMQPRRG